MSDFIFGLVFGLSSGVWLTVVALKWRAVDREMKARRQ